MREDREEVNGKVDRKVAFYRLFSFADRVDIGLMMVGAVSGLANGLAQPLMMLVFGGLINSFGFSPPSQVVHEVSKACLKFLYLAIGAGIASFLQVSCWMVTGERQATHIRGLYLETILRQDITFFDTETNTGEVIGRISGDTVLIQDAMGEKVASFTGENLATKAYNSKLYGLAIWYGAKLIIENGYNGGQVLSVIMVIMTGGMSLGQASPCLSAFAAGQAAIYKMFETIKRRPQIDAYDTSGIVFEEIKGEIELKDVYFAYPSRPDVQIFSGYTLKVPSGTTAALVGQSGSGKSTVISLLQRFYDPNGGEILIDGINLKAFQLRWIRQKMGLVSQEPILFTTTIRENIAYGKENATNEEIRTAIELANAAKFIDKLPKNPEGAYNQLVRLQDGINEVEDGQTRGAYSLHTDISMERSSSRSLSFNRPVSRGSSGSWRSFRGSFQLSTPIGIMTEIEGNETIKEIDTYEKRPCEVSIWRLAYLNKPELPILLLGFVASSLSGVVFPLLGVILSASVKMFYEPKSELNKDSRFWALVYVGLGIATLVVILVRNYCFGVAGGKLIQRIRSLSFEKVVHQEISWFDDPKNSSGAVGARLSTDASTVRSLVGDALAQVVQNMATVIAGLVIAFTANWILALIILVVLPLVVLQGFFQQKFIDGFSDDAKATYEEASQVANDAIGSIRTIASFCAEKKVMDMYQTKCQAPMKQGVRVGLVSGTGFGFSLFLFYCTNAFCFYIGALLVEHGKATYEDVFKVFFALTISAVGVSQSTALAPDTTKAKDSAASIFEILDSKPKIDSSSNEGTTLKTVYGDIELKHVSFMYPTRPNVPIFRDLCVTIPSGKTVALVGESGCGKSTVISLIERFYNPESGHIFLDGVEIQKFKLSWLRQQMGLTTFSYSQDCRLQSKSI
ncbi:hypothetical protein RHSIM_Rhsim04G0241300 [Rhododendron simsii]|uniref:Uncharacterized protein n=1 Tax=Rhododendron simsii TaxID=118357 RepID=A0A834LRQ8_RHOSS|nr:hypothetical protein RHSIM_Rhsim04G0241300 [Rhododendron simsii]